jgi:hypothetical protein
MPSQVLVQLAEVLSHDWATNADRELASRLLNVAARGRLEERELRRIAVAMTRAHDYQGALALIELHLVEHPDWVNNPSLRQLRGDSLIGLAKRCRATAKRPGVASTTRARAWHEFHAYLDRAEADLRDARALSVDDHLNERIQRNLDYLVKLRRENQPPEHRPQRARRQ